jgi:hypothetical protein
MDASKFRVAVKAGQSRFGSEATSRTQFYVVVFACCVTAAVQLVLAYRGRSRVDAVIAIAVWLVFAPAFSWYWFHRKRLSS